MGQIVDKVDQTVYKNSHTEIRGQVFNSNGNPYPIPSATFKLTVKLHPFDDDDDAYLIKSSANTDFLILDSDEGKFRTEISPDDLEDVPEGEYQYDIKMTEANNKKSTVLAGRFIVLNSVTGA